MGTRIGTIALVTLAAGLIPMQAHGESRAVYAGHLGRSPMRFTLAVPVYAPGTVRGVYDLHIGQAHVAMPFSGIYNPRSKSFRTSFEASKPQINTGTLDVKRLRNFASGFHGVDGTWDATSKAFVVHVTMMNGALWDEGSIAYARTLPSPRR